MPDVRFDCLFGQEEALADLAVDEAVRDQLKYLDLAGRRILAQLSRRRRRERDNRSMSAGATACRGRLEAAAVVPITAKDLFTLSGVHASGIGAPAVPL